MISTASWFFYSTTLWPGYSAGSDSNVNGTKNGLSVRVDQYRDITLNDSTGDGKIFDSDCDDGLNAKGDTITVDGVNKQVHEIGAYDNSTIVVGGTTYTVQLGVWVFDDGTYGVRMSDSAIPVDLHHHKVTQINLGTWNGTDYVGSYVKTYTKPFVCFAAGTLIDTMGGPRPVESLAVGETGAHARQRTAADPLDRKARRCGARDPGPGADPGRGAGQSCRYPPVAAASGLVVGLARRTLLRRTRGFGSRPASGQ